MLRITLKSIASNKIRFALTASAVVVGVAFVVASFVVADSLRSTFSQLSSDINEGKDYIVRAEVSFGDRNESVAPAVDEDLLAPIRALEGVAEANGSFFVFPTIPVDGSGEPITTIGPPVAGVNWTENPDISQLYLIDGRRPVGVGEFALGADTVADNDFEIGGVYNVVTPTGPREFELVGTMQFGFPDNAAVGAVLSIFDTSTAQEVLGYAGRYQEISIQAEPGIDHAALERAISDLLPETVEVVTVEVVEEEFSDAFEAIIGPLGTILLVFAFIVMFVSLFIITNTFTIILGQRTRELALLRAIGASPRQVRNSVLGEALAIGIFAVIIGIGLGMLGALGIRALFSALGGNLPDGPLPLKLRTIVWAICVGVGFTVAAAIVPAIKAARKSPVAALAADPGGDEDVAHRWRPWAGGGLASLGMILTGVGLFSGFDSAATQLSILGLGAALVFVAVAVLSPLIAAPVVRWLAIPVARMFGISGRLARQNSARNPRRTAATAVALTIGLALVCLVSVVGQSLKTSFAATLDTGANVDFVVTEETRTGLPTTLADDLRSVDDLATVVAFRQDFIRVDGNEKTVSATTLADVEQVINLDVTAGSPTGVDPSDALLLHEDPAEDLGVAVGDTVTMEFRSGDSRELTVAAVFAENALSGSWVIDLELFDAVTDASFDNILLMKLAEGADANAVRPSIDDLLEPYPQARLENEQEFLDRLEGQIDTVLALVNAFLALALIIALFGIVNTLTLSIFERTREIGLLRAIGMTRRQTRRMIRWEAAVVALFGALIGVVLGIAFGVAIATAIPSEIINTVDVPIVTLAIYVVLATIFGLLAAILPARRAARLNVLDAISHGA